MPLGAEELDVAAVQFEVTEETYADTAAFEKRVSAVLETSADAGADLVVFPEYLNVFLLFDDYSQVVARSSSIEEALSRLTDGDEASLEALLRREIRTTGARIMKLWGELARRYELHIVAGTHFTLSEDTLRNRALVFGPDGRLLETQDKHYLTPFEKEELNLEPGPIREVDTFEVAGYEVGLTICRDSYFAEWESRLGDADLWIDLRANGEEYSQAVKKRFQAALSERVAGTPVRAGANATLTGDYLDLLWEGPSYVVNPNGRRIAESAEVRGTSIVLFSLGRAGGPHATQTQIVQGATK